MSNLEALKGIGVTPLTFFTGENSWTTQNVLVSIVGTQNEESNALMNSDDKIKDWNTPEIKEALEMVKIMLRDYSSSDAIGGVYANVANYFLQEKAAIMPNGAWMIPDFPIRKRPARALPIRSAWRCIPAPAWWRTTTTAL